MNAQKNNTRLERIQKAFGVEVSMNIHGQAVMGTAVSTEIPTENPPTQISQTSTQMSISIAETFQVCGDECKYLTALDNICTTKVPWNFTLHAGQKALLDYVLDTMRTPDEPIVDVGTTTLKRSDFISLGLHQHEVEATIANCCFQMMSDIGMHQGKDVQYMPLMHM
ncbi:hypothetical protein R3I94_010867 [Phoxinus phoxinus]